jgi:hypothetical protein
MIYKSSKLTKNSIETMWIDITNIITIANDGEPTTLFSCSVNTAFNYFKF